MSDWELCTVNRPWISAQSSLQYSLSHSLGLRTEHQFWCLTAHYPLSRVYMGAWALWIHLCWLEKFHKALSDSDNWFMQHRACFMEPYDLMEFSEIQYEITVGHGSFTETFLLQFFMNEQITTKKVTILKARLGWWEHCLPPSFKNNFE